LWRPLASVDLIALAEHDGSRWANNTVKLSGYSTLNLKTVWRATKSLSAEIGVNNLADKNYELDYGFPNPGRMWFATLNYRL
jgi:iron complex outermembrane receptor protein